MMTKGSIKNGRAAFLLNINAKSVTPKFRRQVSDLVPKNDLYFSHNLKEAIEHCSNILKKNYAFIFCGGGDGTVVNTINILLDLQKKQKLISVPKIGILRLGTGNALARMLKAAAPLDDIKDILAGKKMDHHLVSMVETEEKHLTPFAGLGYDGEIISDFSSLKGIFFKSPLRKIFTSVLGFALVTIFKTIPKELIRKPIKVKIKSNFPAYQIIYSESEKKDEEVLIDRDSLLFKGFAALIAVGTIKSVGYDFVMFPFAKRRPGYLHLRVSAVPIATCLANIMPIWKGTFRHEKLYDYLVKDVEIEASKEIAYQLAGDAMGKKSKLYLKISDNLIPMVSINRNKDFKITKPPVLTPLG